MDSNGRAEHLSHILTEDLAQKRDETTLPQLRLFSDFMIEGALAHLMQSLLGIGKSIFFLVCQEWAIFEIQNSQKSRKKNSNFNMSCVSIVLMQKR